MTIEVKKNHFFTRYYPTVTAPVSGDFPDLPLTGAATYELESYDQNTSVLLSSSTSPIVTYGNYELVGGYLRTYMSDISLGSQTSKPPYFGVYKLKDEWPITEGGFSIATNGGNKVGQKMRLMQVNSHVGDNILYQENFDGEDKALLITGNPLTNHAAFKRARYTVPLSIIADILKWTTGEASTVDSMTIAIPAQHEELIKHVADLRAAHFVEVGGSSPSAGRRGAHAYKFNVGAVAIPFIVKNGSSWEAEIDSSIIIQNADIVKSGQVITTTSRGYTVVEDSSGDITGGIHALRSSLEVNTGVQAESNNTILSAFKQSINFENPWSSGVISPLLKTDILLSEGEGKDGNAALEMYHMWEMADEYKSVTGTSATETMLGVSGNINPQVAMAGIWNIPVPAITDNGRNITDAADSGSTKYVTVPEISLDVKIAKLEPAPLYAIKSNPTFYGRNGSTGTIKLAYGWKDANLNGVSTSGCTDFEASTIDNGMQFMNTTYGDKMDSLLRSFTICFSNYKPLSRHHTLDEFLEYGLANFYGSGASASRDGRGADRVTTPMGQDINRGIVGGITFRRQVMDDDDNTTTLVAEALPVTRNYDAFAPKGSTDVKARNPYAKQNGWKPICDSDTIDTASSMDVVALQNSIPIGTVITFASGRTWTLTADAAQGATAILGTPVAAQGTIASGSEATTNIGDNIGIPGDINFYGMAILEGADTNTPKTRVSLGTLPYSRNFNANKKVEIPTNTFFNLRFFMDVIQKSSVFSQTKMPYIRFPGGTSGEGVMMRCIIDTDDTAADADNDTGSEDMLFIDIPFPVGILSGAADSIQYPGLNSAGASSGGDGNAQGPWSVADNNTNLFPRYMTMWLHNYRWCSGSDDSDWFKYGDNNALMNQEDGGSVEAQVFIDNITLKNFMPQLVDATATNYTRGIVNMDPGTAQTPLTLITGQSGSGSAGDILMNAFSSDGSGHTYSSSLTGTTGVSPSNTTANLVDVAPGSYILMGFENKDDIPQDHTSNGQYGYWMMNNFWTNNFTDLSGSSYSVTLSDSGYLRNSALLNMGYSNTGGTGMSKNKYFGLQFYSQLNAASGTPTFFDNGKGSEFDVVSADVAIDPTNADAQMKIILPTGANDIYSADGFTQKGFGYLSVSGTSATVPSHTSWGKREHILASTKIVGVAGVSTADPWGPTTIDNDRSIRVADPDIFATHNDDSYIIYRIYGDGTATTHVKGVASPLKLESPNSVTDNIATFSESVLLADDGTTKLCTETHLSELYICPYKYWLTIALDSGAEKVPRSYGQWVFVNETPATGSIATQTGSTFNESPYFYDTGASFSAGNQGKSALYQNDWTLIAGDITSAIQTDVDYGMGVVEHADGSSTTYSPTTGFALGVVDSKPAKVDSYIDYALHGLITAGTLAEGPAQDFGMMLTSLDKTNTKKATLYTSDSTDTEKTPRFYWNYYDAVPQQPTLTLSPAVQLIPSGGAPAKEKIDLYNITSENLNAIRFEWKEQDDDIWYRYILTGASEGVTNKYKGAKWYAPLSEIPADQDLGTAPTYVIYDEVLGTSSNATNGGVVLSDLNGLSGWTAVFPGTGTTSYLSIAFANNNFPSGSAGELSIVTHCIPASNAGSGDDLQWIAYRGHVSVAGEGYRVGITGCTGTSPTVFVSGAGVTMTGTSVVPFDGLTPLSIIATFKSGSNIGPDANLYVNGIREDFQNTATGGFTSTDASYIGSIGSSNRFRGSIEEVILYDQELIVPTQANTWVHSTANAADMDASGNIISHTARLFLFDYHNIRGKSPTDVCQSNDCVWRTTI